jgi:hypothetical protein
MASISEAGGMGTSLHPLADHPPAGQVDGKWMLVLWKGLRQDSAIWSQKDLGWSSADASLKKKA